MRDDALPTISVIVAAVAIHQIVRAFLGNTGVIIFSGTDRSNVAAESGILPGRPSPVSRIAANAAEGGVTNHVGRDAEIGLKLLRDVIERRLIVGADFIRNIGSDDGPVVDRGPEPPRNQAEEVVNVGIKDAFPGGGGEVRFDALIADRQRCQVGEHTDFGSFLAGLLHRLLGLDHHLKAWHAPEGNAGGIAPVNWQHHINPGRRHVAQLALKEDAVFVAVGGGVRGWRV